MRAVQRAARLLAVNGTPSLSSFVSSSLTALPEDLRKAAESAERGDFLLYSDRKDRHHVIAVEKVFPAQQQPYEAAREQIVKIIFQEKAKELIADWGEKLREAYETRIFVTGVDD